MAVELVRLSASHIRLGGPLPGNVLDDGGKLLLSKGQVLSDQGMLDRLLARGIYVDLATFDTQFRHPESAPVQVDQRYDPFAVHASLKMRLSRLLNGVLDRSATPAAIVELAQQIIVFVDHDAEAAMASSLLDRHIEVYPVGHGLNSAVLCAAIAKVLGWEPQARLTAVCAAMTMNLGMLEYHQRLHRQTTALTSVQTQTLKTHPEAAVALLKAIGVVDERWLEAILEHHDTPAGNGYHTKASTCDSAQMLRVVDVFDARANDRGDRKATPPAMVIRKLFADEGQGPYSSYPGALIKRFGIFPPGSFVRLASHELAVVFRHGETPNTPVVAAVTTGTGAPLMNPHRRETWRKDFAITGAVVPDNLALGYDLAKLWISRA